MFSSALLPIASRVSSVALPRCGSSTTFSIFNNSDVTAGSRWSASGGCRRNLPLLQRSHQRCLVHDVTARGVDKNGRLFHLAESLGVHQMARLGECGAMQRNEISLREHRLERLPRFGAEGRLRYERIVKDHFHAESVVRLFRHRWAIRPKPTTERLAAHHGAHHVRRPPAGPLAASHMPLSFARTARRHEQQRPSRDPPSLR